MKAQVFSHEKLIGITELYLGDASMGCLFGDFIPNKNYYDYVQKAIWDFWSNSKPDHGELTLLKINVQLDNGYFLFAAGGFTIQDIKELSEEPKKIDVAGVDRHVINDFFRQIEPRPFVEEPWESISIGQKLAFEKELKLELGIYNDRPFWRLFSFRQNEHILADFEASALCRKNDDVVFVIRKLNYEKDLALVHLTWRGAKEVQGYPKFEFYENFDEFKYYRMYPDKADWEY